MFSGYTVVVIQWLHRKPSNTASTLIICVIFNIKMKLNMYKWKNAPQRKIRTRDCFGFPYADALGIKLSGSPELRSTSSAIDAVFFLRRNLRQNATVIEIVRLVLKAMGQELEFGKPANGSDAVKLFWICPIEKVE